MAYLMDIHASQGFLCQLLCPLFSKRCFFADIFELFPLFGGKLFDVLFHDVSVTSSFVLVYDSITQNNYNATAIQWPVENEALKGALKGVENEALKGLLKISEKMV